MNFVASIFEDVLLKRENVENVNREIERYMKDFNGVSFSFSDKSMEDYAEGEKMAKVVGRFRQNSQFTAADWLTKGGRDEEDIVGIPMPPGRSRKSSVPEKWIPNMKGC